MRNLSIFALAASWLLILSPAADASDVVRITNNSTQDIWPLISGSNVVWMGCDGGTDYLCTGGDYEIYMTTVAGPIPAPSISFGGLALLAGLVLGSVAWVRRHR